MANRLKRGLLTETETFVNHSIIGSKFTGRLHSKVKSYDRHKVTLKAKIVETGKMGETDYLVPKITGSAFLTARTEIVLDDADPFPTGFRVGDIWA